MKLNELIEKYKNKEVDEQAVINMLGLKKSDKPEYGDTYWYVDSLGNVISCIWLNMPGDNYRYFRGNCFATEEEAETYKRVLYTEGKLKLYAKEHNDGAIDWYDFEQEKYYLQLNVDDECKYIDFIYKFRQPREIYFTSYEIANAAVEEIGEEAVMEYLQYEW